MEFPFAQMSCKSTFATPQTGAQQHEHHFDLRVPNFPRLGNSRVLLESPPLDQPVRGSRYL